MAKMDMSKMLEMKKKDGKEIDPAHKEAKMSMLKALRDEMSGMMSDDLRGHSLKKVEIAAPDKSGLEHGLDKAKEIIAGHGDQPEDGSEEDDSDMGDFGSQDTDPASDDFHHDLDASSGDEEAPLSPEEEEMMHKLLARSSKHKM